MVAKIAYCVGFGLIQLSSLLSLYAIAKGKNSQIRWFNFFFTQFLVISVCFGSIDGCGLLQDWAYAYVACSLCFSVIIVVTAMLFMLLPLLKHIHFPKVGSDMRFRWYNRRRPMC